MLLLKEHLHSHTTTSTHSHTCLRHTLSVCLSVCLSACVDLFFCVCPHCCVWLICGVHTGLLCLLEPLFLPLPPSSLTSSKPSSSSNMITEGLERKSLTWETVSRRESSDKDQPWLGASRERAIKSFYGCLANRQPAGQEHTQRVIGCLAALLISCLV